MDDLRRRINRNFAISTFILYFITRRFVHSAELQSMLQILIILTIASSPWLFYIAGLKKDKRWIFYVPEIRSRVDPRSIRDSAWSLLVLFPLFYCVFEVTKNLWYIFSATIIVFGILLLSKFLTRTRGIYIYVLAQLEAVGDSAARDDDCESPGSLSHTSDSHESAHPWSGKVVFLICAVLAVCVFVSIHTSYEFSLSSTVLTYCAIFIFFATVFLHVLYFKGVVEMAESEVCETDYRPSEVLSNLSYSNVSAAGCAAILVFLICVTFAVGMFLYAFFQFSLSAVLFASCGVMLLLFLVQGYFFLMQYVWDTFILNCAEMLRFQAIEPASANLLKRIFRNKLAMSRCFNFFLPFLYVFVFIGLWRMSG